MGCRFSLYPLCDDFGPVVLGAVDTARKDGLEVDTDDVSTYVSGADADVLRFVRDAVAFAAGRAGHVMASLLLSRGCPGEVECTPTDAPAAPDAEPPILEPAGVWAAAHWSVYPLGAPDHMDLIAGAVAQARHAGTYSGSTHYVTRLERDLAEVLNTVAAGWLAAGRAVPHVVSHVTLSLGSPGER